MIDSLRSALDGTAPGAKAFSGADGFAALVESNVAGLLKVARAIVSSEDLAWDAVQEALIAFWRCGSAAPDARAWLVRAVAHRALHQCRTRRRCVKHERLACDACPESREQDPSNTLEYEELRRSLGRAIDSLELDHRQVLVLRDLEGLSYEQVADRLAVPVGTIRSRLNRARSALRAQLELRLTPGDFGRSPAPLG